MSVHTGLHLFIIKTNIDAYTDNYCLMGDAISL